METRHNLNIPFTSAVFLAAVLFVPACMNNDGYDPTDFTLAGYVDCDRVSAYGDQCLPPVPDLVGRLSALGGRDVNKDKFAWSGYLTPGGVNQGTKRHMQSIQYFETHSYTQPPGFPEPVWSFARYLAVTMSDEYADTDSAGISLVAVDAFGSEGGNDDHVVHQRLLNEDPEVMDYNHAGGAQLIGEYLFVALEDMENHSVAKTGVWRIERTNPPTLSFKYAFDVGTEDYHHSAIGVTRLADGTYLAAACVEVGCDSIHFLRSRGKSLENNPGFTLVYRWVKNELYPEGDNWADCHPQNINLAVDESGDIYLVMFGVEKTGAATCGMANGDDQIYVYKLEMTEDREIKLAFITKKSIGTGDKCDWGVDVTGTNFDAGAGLMFTPWRSNPVSVLATEHYDSCGSGKTRWGVTASW